MLPCKVLGVTLQQQHAIRDEASVKGGFAALVEIC